MYLKRQIYQWPNKSRGCVKTTLSKLVNNHFKL